jgi:predicted outer membrane repeat protein
MHYPRQTSPSSLSTLLSRSASPARVTYARRIFVPFLALALLAAAGWVAASSRLAVSHASKPSAAPGEPLPAAPTAFAIITVTNTADSGPGSLRQAIAAAPGGDTINFNIPPSDPGCNAQTGVCTIRLTTGPLIVNRDITISGPGSKTLAVSGDNTSGVFSLTSLVTISGLTITQGKAVTGGGIHILQAESLTLLNCEFVGNEATAAGGGAIGGVAGAGELIKISGSSFTGNRAFGNGGAIDSSGFNVEIIKSTFSGNLSGSGSQPADGGALSIAAGQVTITNSTFSGNQGANNGGAIYSPNVAVIDIINSTITANTTFFRGGGVTSASSAHFNARNTIIAGNNAPNGPDFFGSLSSLGHNLLGNNRDTVIAPAPGDKIGIPLSPINPRLGPLKNNGGPTFTHDLLPGSPALDAGDNAVTGPPLSLTTDQRGAQRPFNAVVDIGAVEFEPHNFVVTNTSNSGPGSLRQAILDANARPNLNPFPDTISFNIPGVVRTIAPSTQLPDITEAVVIDGYTQPGATPNTSPAGSNAVLLIELSGASAPGASGLVLRGGGSTIRGLVINRFTDRAINLQTSGGNTIEGCFIGTDASGTTARGGGGILFVTSSNNTVGGTTHAARNIISGTSHHGVDLFRRSNGNVVVGNYIGTNASGNAPVPNAGNGILVHDSANNRLGGIQPGEGNVISGNNEAITVQTDEGFASTGNQILGNFIGTDATGTFQIGNLNGGVRINQANNTVGGASPGSRNVISGNLGWGVNISNPTATGNTVAGNFIGTDATGTSALGNSGAGVLLSAGAKNNVIGGSPPAESNTIAFNGAEGVRLSADGGLGDRIASNSIHSNGGLGIDLGGNGVTPNDAGDADAGPNRLQNFPFVISATIVGGLTTIPLTLNSTPGTGFRVQFFKNDSCDASGNGEGQTLLLSTDISTDAGGNGGVTASVAGIAAGQFITATATRLATGDTSEFSPCVAATVPVVSTVVKSMSNGGPDSLRQIIADAPAGSTITFGQSVAGTIDLTGEILIDKALTINGPGSSVLTVRGDGDNRVFNVIGNGVVISGLTISSRPPNDPNNQSPTIDGAGLRNSGVLTVNDCVVSNNLSVRGGGIFNSGELTVNRSTISQNATTAGGVPAGGGIYNDGGKLTISDGSRIENNNGTFTRSGKGGGIANTSGGTLDVFDSAVSHNRAGNAGGGIYNNGNSKLTVKKSTVSGNSAAFGEGGGILVDNQNQSVGVLVRDTTLGDNEGGHFGGGIGVRSGSVEINGCSISGNSVTDRPAAGGGIGNIAGVVKVVNTTLSGNRATTSGGGISNNAGHITVINTTISGHISPLGAGVSNGTGMVVVISSTIACNTASHPSGGVGGGIFTSAGTVTLRSSIVAINRATELAGERNPGDIRGNDIKGNVVSLGHNLIGDTRAANITYPDASLKATDQTGNPALGPLQDNGGPTLTHAPLVIVDDPLTPVVEQSPLINKGDAAVVADFGLSFDQRGLPRQAGGSVDIGAVELKTVGISGVVTFNGVGLPCATLTLSGKQSIVTRTNADRCSDTNTAPPNADGTFTIDVPPGLYTLTPSKPGFVFFPASVPIDSTGGSVPASIFTATSVLSGDVATPASDDFGDPSLTPFNLGLLSKDPAAFNPQIAVDQAEQQLNITPPEVEQDPFTKEVTKDGSFDGNSFNGYVSKEDIDINVSTSVSVKLVKPLAGVGAQTLFSVGTDKDNFIEMRVEDVPATPTGGASAKSGAGASAGGTLSMNIVLKGQPKFKVNVPYNSDASHLRIRYDATTPTPTFIFETRGDRTNWSSPCASAGMNASDCKPQFKLENTHLATQLGAGTLKRVDNPGTASFDDYNVAQPTSLTLTQTDFSVAENNRHINIKLKREGGADSPASVVYSIIPDSLPGAAVEPVASGTLLFNEGETGEKTFAIDNPIGDDTRRQGSRTFTILFSNPLGGTLAVAERSATLTINDDEFTGNPIDDPSFFTSQQYCDFFQREADRDGHTFWSSQFNRCQLEVNCLLVEQVHVSDAFFRSIEFNDTGYFVYRLYQSSFGRMPLRAEFMPDMTTVRGTVVVGQGDWEAQLRANQRQFLDAWVQRPAFKAAYDPLNSGAYVDAIYKNAGVPLANDRRAELTLKLALRQKTRADVLGELIQAAEFGPGRLHSNRAFVLMEYFGYLLRDPDPEGFNFWLTKLNSFGGDPVASEMIKAFVTSKEYRDRFLNTISNSCGGN